jgi:RNA polymerase sigma factor (TIGR02999 family)
LVTLEPANVTQLLEAAKAGDRDALDGLLAAVYDDLRALAERIMRRESPGHTLQPTALVHEAYMRLVDQRSASFDDRAHFFAAAATVIRRILVDHARARKAAKRGGDWQRVTIECDTPSGASPVDLLALDEALVRLTEINAQQARIVELRFFAGLPGEQTAMVMGIGKRSADRGWQSAKAWLYRELAGDQTDETSS